MAKPAVLERLRLGVPLMLLGLALPGLALWPAQAGAQVPAELSHKVRLALSLARFAQWPAAPAGEPLHLCLAQRNTDVQRAFAEVDGKPVNGRRVVLQKAPPLQGCDLLFVHASADQTAELVRAAQASATLTIGDGEGFVAQGGMVELVVVDDALRFDINMPPLRQAQLGLASQVLRLVRRVKE